MWLWNESDIKKKGAGVSLHLIFWMCICNKFAENKKGTHFCVPYVVTRTGIGRSARRALVAGGSEDHSGLHSLPPCSIPLSVKFRTKQKADTFVPAFLCGDPDGNRTRVTAVKGRCLSRLTTGPSLDCSTIISYIGVFVNTFFEKS